MRWVYLQREKGSVARAWNEGERTGTGDWNGEASPLLGNDSLVSCARLEASLEKAAICTYSCKNILSDSIYKVL